MCKECQFWRDSRRCRRVFVSASDGSTITSSAFKYCPVCGKPLPETRYVVAITVYDSSGIPFSAYRAITGDRWTTDIKQAAVWEDKAGAEFLSLQDGESKVRTIEEE